MVTPTCINQRPVPRPVPCSEKERARGDKEAWACSNNRVGLLDRAGEKFSPKYAFDLVFDPASSNAELFQAIGRPTLIPALTGINGTIFAYGVTSSGKTHTMMGSAGDPGMVPRVIRELFSHVGAPQMAAGRAFRVKMAVMEIYNEVGFGYWAFGVWGCLALALALPLI